MSPSSAMRQVERERLNVCLALTMPTDKLYVTYSESDFQGLQSKESFRLL